MTLCLSHWWRLADSFNPHTHEGCDVNFRLISRSLFQFQSTHPRRVWRIAALRQATALQFQSTHPRRVWHTFSRDMPTNPVFQSTHPRRVWPWLPWWRLLWCLVSIHTPTKGVTQLEATINKLVKVSIHTPTKGVTSFCGWVVVSFNGFNPHTHEGCDVRVK